MENPNCIWKLVTFVLSKLQRSLEIQRSYFFAFSVTDLRISVTYDTVFPINSFEVDFGPKSNVCEE